MKKVTLQLDYFFRMQQLVMQIRRRCIDEYWEHLGGSDPLDGLTKRQRSYLFTIFQRGACSLEQFRESNGLSVSAASTAVDKMVRAGILRREQNAANRRMISITVVPTIAAHLQKIDKVFQQKVSALLTKNCALELPRLEAAAEKICQALTSKENNHA